MQEERLLVLKMLARRKVTPEQAEHLIEALESAYEPPETIQDLDRQMYEAATYSFRHDTALEAPADIGGISTDFIAASRSASANLVGDPFLVSVDLS